MNFPNPTIASSNLEPASLPGLQTMKRLITVVQELSLARDLESIMTIVRVAARKLAYADGASFVLRDKNQCFYADEDAIAPLWKGQRFPMDICIGGWTMRNRQPAIIENIYGDERIPFAAYQPTFVKSLAMIPIRTIDPIGAIGVYWAQCHHPDSEEIELLQALADTTAVALENVQVYTELEQRIQDRTMELEFTNAQLQEEIKERKKIEAIVQQLSITDELTGLSNRRGFLLLAEQQLKLAYRANASVGLLFIDLDGLKLKLAYRANASVGLLFIDLDGLKQVNDRLGHEMGDHLIVDASQVLKQTFRESDVVARIGGDEFAVFVPGFEARDDVTTRLEMNISRFNQTSERSYRLSMSLGLAVCQAGETTSLKQMMTQADQLMYQHKRTKY